MKRREFLLMAAAFSATSLVAIAKPSMTLAMTFTSAKSLQYRGGDGKVYKSEDMGATWAPFADFGDQVQIIQVYASNNGMIIVKLMHSGHDFRLVSSDELTWRPQERFTVSSQ